MNNLYTFNEVYGFQGTMDPILEIELRKCKTQEEKENVIEDHQAITLLGSVVAIVVGALVCGVISLLMQG